VGPAGTSRRVAVLGGNRIPFARSDGAYAEASNQDMFTAALGGLVDRFGLAGQQLGVVAGGAVLKHSRDFNLMRECVLGTALSPYTPAFDLQQACGTGLQACIAAVGGRARFSGFVTDLMLGEVEELWDMVAIAEYPSRAAMMQMVQSPEYQSITKHRDAGLAGQLNIRTKAVG